MVTRKKPSVIGHESAIPTARRCLVGRWFERQLGFTWYVIHVVSGSTLDRRPRGRRSLNGVGDSPQLRVRVPDELRRALSEEAERQGTTVSDLARHLLTAAVGTAVRPEERVQLEL